MYNYRLAYYFSDAESVGKKSGKSISLAAEQRRHITGVIGMGATAGIVMGHCIGKWIMLRARTGVTAVNVKSKNSAGTFFFGVGQRANIHHNENTVWRMVKFYRAFYSSILFAAVYFSYGTGMFSHCLCKY